MELVKKVNRTIVLYKVYDVGHIIKWWMYELKPRTRWNLDGWTAKHPLSPRVSQSQKGEKRPNSTLNNIPIIKSIIKCGDNITYIDNEIVKLDLMG